MGISWKELVDPTYDESSGIALIILIRYGLNIRGRTMSELAPDIYRLAFVSEHKHTEGWRAGRMQSWLSPILIDWMDPGEVVCEGYNEKPIFSYTQQDWIEAIVAFIDTDEAILDLLEWVLE